MWHCSYFTGYEILSKVFYELIFFHSIPLFSHLSLSLHPQNTIHQLFFLFVTYSAGSIMIKRKLKVRQTTFQTHSSNIISHGAQGKSPNILKHPFPYLQNGANTIYSECYENNVEKILKCHVSVTYKCSMYLSCHLLS